MPKKIDAFSQKVYHIYWSLCFVLSTVKNPINYNLYMPDVGESARKQKFSAYRCRTILKKTVSCVTHWSFSQSAHAKFIVYKISSIWEQILKLCTSEFILLNNTTLL